MNKKLKNLSDYFFDRKLYKFRNAPNKNIQALIDIYKNTLHSENESLFLDSDYRAMLDNASKDDLLLLFKNNFFDIHELMKKEKVSFSDILAHSKNIDVKYIIEYGSSKQHLQNLTKILKEYRRSSSFCLDLDISKSQKLIISKKHDSYDLTISIKDNEDIYFLSVGHIFSVVFKDKKIILNDVPSDFVLKDMYDDFDLVGFLEYLQTHAVKNLKNVEGKKGTSHKPYHTDEGKDESVYPWVALAAGATLLCD